MAETMTTLPEALYSQMKGEKFVLLHTIDAESHIPTSSAISWIRAFSPTQLRLAVDKRSRLIANMTTHEGVTLTVFAAGTVYAISGKAKLKAETMDEVPIKLSCFEIQVEHVREAMFYGARITSEPEYEKTYDLRAAEKLDNQVFSAMQKA